jgi:hypothetical protein
VWKHGALRWERGDDFTAKDAKKDAKARDGEKTAETQRRRERCSDDGEGRTV